MKADSHEKDRQIKKEVKKQATEMIAQGLSKGQRKRQRKQEAKALNAAKKKETSRWGPAGAANPESRCSGRCSGCRCGSRG
jgi:hypothetical protein